MKPYFIGNDPNCCDFTEYILDKSTKTVEQHAGSSLAWAISYTTSFRLSMWVSLKYPGMM